MRSLGKCIDKFITALYIASLIGGVLVCIPKHNGVPVENLIPVNVRSVASVGTDLDYMTADDFLIGGEKAADKQGINDYLDELKRTGLPNEASQKSEEEEDEYPEAYEPAEDVKDERPEIDADDWRLILVNKQNPVPSDFDVKLANINGSMYADERIISDIYEMIDAASEDGVDLMICSAYRSYDRQRTLFNNKINKLMNEGMTYLEAYKVGSMNVTVPGTSEHHLGLALDILTGSYTTMDDGFGETEAGKWLAANAQDYGFILRYPKGKEEITGIVYEPWHFRYVGRRYAKEITSLGVCLEEYLKGEY